MAQNFGGFLLHQFGAYIQTDLSSLQSISGTGSGIIAMVGLAEKGPVNEAVTVTSYSELVEIFGNGPLVVSGLAAYVGGASTIVAVRLGGTERASLTAIEAAPGSSAAYEYFAREEGTSGNNIFVSVEVNDAGTPGDFSDDTYVIRTKYIDSLGNDMRETFVVPRYIPDMSGKYYDNNPGDYYVLYNTEDGTLREVPTTWGFGNLDVDDFLTKVEDMKGPEERLLGPFPADSGDNPFPLALIAAAINNGGFGQAPSRVVYLEGADPSMEDLLAPGYTYDPQTAEQLLPHPYVQMNGGYNGDDGTNYFGKLQQDGTVDWDMTYSNSSAMDSWDDAFNVLEDEEVNFVQPAYLFNGKGTSLNWSNRYGFFKALAPRLLAHITTMSNIPNRMFRTSVLGLPYYKLGPATANNTAADFLDEIQDISGVINNDRVQLWAGGFKSNAFSNGVKEYGGEMLANFVVGAHAARTPSTSLTFAQISGIISHGLEFAFNSSQRDELYMRRHGFVMKRRTAAGAVEYVAAHNYTSFTGAPSRGMGLMITRRIVDYVSSTVYKNLEETFIGRKSRGSDTERMIADYAAAILQRMVREDIITAYSNVQVRADDLDKTVYHVTYEIQPLSEVSFILVTQSLTYSLT